MSVTGGFQAQFREKVLGVNAHVLVLKYSTDFREYRKIMEQVAQIPGVEGTAPFSINPMMLTHGDATATGVLLKGVDPAKSLGVGGPPGQKPVLILPQQVVGCEEAAKQGTAAAIACGQEKLKGLRLPDAKPAERRVNDGRSFAFDEPEPPDAGSPEEVEIDDAGRDLKLIRAIEADIRRREQEKDARPGEAPAPRQEEEAQADAGPIPQGEIAPAGGYKSKLPDDDAVLPADVDPDPCANPAKVAELPGIVVGITLAKTLNLTYGDCVTVTSPTIGYSFSGGALKPPVARRYKVIALFQAGFDQYDSKLVYTDLFEAQTFYDQGDTVTGVEMIVSDIDQAPRISKEIADMLGSGLYHTMDWEELNHGLFTALRIQQIGMSVVLALIILVAAFTVVATLIMVVLDKKKEISVMKAMGATDGAILRIFLYQGGIIGLVGTGLGLLLGVLVCKGLLVYGFPLDPKVYFISRLPVQVRPLEFIITGEVALAICIAATVLPSLYAANLSPVDGFRDEDGSDEKEKWPASWFLTAAVASIAANLFASILAVVQTAYNLGLLGRLFIGGLVVLGALFAVVAEVIRWLNMVQGGTQRRMPWSLSGRLLALHAVNVAMALIVLIQLEIGSLAGFPRWALAAIGLGCVAVAVCSLGLHLWKRWGLYGLVVMHLLALPILWMLGAQYGSVVPLVVRLVVLAVPLYSLAFLTVGVRRYWRILD
jgi:lipoprotein-releasing system permease protein